MKNQRKLAIILLLCLLAVLLIPFHMGRYDDGGTTRLTSLTYTVVNWNRFLDTSEDGTVPVHENTCVYLFPHNFKSLSELWEIKH